MDEIDRRLLEELEQNSRQSNMELSKKIGVSEATIRNRIQKMLEKGIIRRFTIERGLNQGLLAFVLINADPHIPSSEVVISLVSLKGVNRIYDLAGPHDYLIEISVNSPLELNEIVDKIRESDGVQKTITLVALRVTSN